MGRAIITYRQAVERKLPRYFTGKPCFRGHYAERETETSVCVECKPINAAEIRLEVVSEKCKITQALYREQKNKRRREHYHENREEKLEKARAYRAKNREKHNKLWKARYEKNREKILARRKELRASKEDQARRVHNAEKQRAYREKNKEAIKLKDLERSRRNREAQNAKKREKTKLCAELREYENDLEQKWLDEQFKIRKLTDKETNRRRYLRCREARRASARRRRLKLKAQGINPNANRSREAAVASCRKSRQNTKALLARQALRIEKQNEEERQRYCEKILRGLDDSSFHPQTT